MYYCCLCFAWLACFRKVVHPAMGNDERFRVLYPGVLLQHIQVGRGNSPNRYKQLNRAWLGYDLT